jgi:Bax protein
MADRLPRRVRVVGVKRMFERRPIASVAVIAALLSMAGSHAPSYSSIIGDADAWAARPGSANSAESWDDAAAAERWAFTPANVADLLQRFALHDYDFANPARNLGVPRLFVSALPADLADAEAAATRKQAFIASLLPLILKRNEEIAADRDRLLRLAESRRLANGSTLALDARDSEWLEDLAEQYGAAPSDLAGLLRRVDVVPASLALAQAAEESGWGRSRVAKSGNALFGQYSWQGGAPPRPGAKAAAKRYKIKFFTGLEAAVASYMHNLNSNPAYREFRDRRAWLRAAGKTAGGLQLVDSIGRYSVRGVDYIDTVRAIIQSNALHKFDTAQLRREDGAVVRAAF